MIKYDQSGPRMSQAVAYGGLLPIAGHVASDHKVGIEAQTKDVLARGAARLAYPHLRIDVTAVAAV